MEIPKICEGCWCLRTSCVSDNKVVPFHEPKCLINHDIPKKYVDEGKCPHFIKDEHISYREGDV